MAVRKTGKSTGDVFEQKMVAFAEQLGTLVGTVQSKAEGWLDRDTLSEELHRIRDSAASLLEQVSGEIAALPAAAQAKVAKVTTSTATKAKPKPKSSPKAAAAPAARPSRGPVDAPGKRHRQPPPQERLDTRMGEPRGKQMGQKSVKISRQGGRG